jgi:hypothetical protein
MTFRTSLIITALSASLFAGCSKHPTEVTPSMEYTDLGAVEVSDGKASYHDLGSGRIAVITPTTFKDGSVELRLALQQTNAAGVVTLTPGPSARNKAGVQFKLGVGDVGISVTPNIKP